MLTSRRREGDRPIIASTETAAVSESLDGLFEGLNWWSDWKESKTSFLGQNWTQNCQNSLKSISRESLVVESWLTPQNDRQKGREGRDSKISISWELNIIAIKLADLSKCAKDIFLLVFITIYDSSTKGNGLKTRNLP